MRSVSSSNRWRVAALSVAAVLAVAMSGACVSGGTGGGARPGGSATEHAAATPPLRLVVVVTVDQMRYDYLERFGGQFTGGFARLLRGGALFTNAFQDHANSATAPGHATTLSGREPYRTGIVLNSIGVGDAGSPLVDADGPGASPRRFRGSTLIDWMRARDRRSRALSVSRKDRGAILPVGRARENVYWYASDGRFTTSRYYADTLPAWVRRFNARRLPHRYAGRSWDLLLPASEYAEPDSVPVEDLGRETAFPHVLSPDTAVALGDIIAFPWMDELTVRFALDGVSALRLGAGSAPDLLAVSLSATDAVGHRFGAASREMHDQMLRLDRTLGLFVDSLYALRDSAGIVFALTADHGGTPPPEVATPTAVNPRPMRVDMTGFTDSFYQSLLGRGVDAAGFDFRDAILFLDPAALRRAGLDRDSVARAFAQGALREPGVARADLFADVLRADTLRDPVARRWRHALPPGLPVAVVVTLLPGNVWGVGPPGVHGSPWDDDTHVPLVLYGPPIRAGRFGDFASVVDLAPTLAAALGVRPTESLDGRVLRAALRAR